MLAFAKSVCFIEVTEDLYSTRSAWFHILQNYSVIFSVTLFYYDWDRLGPSASIFSISNLCGPAKFTTHPASPGRMWTQNLFLNYLDLPCTSCPFSAAALGSIRCHWQIHIRIFFSAGKEGNIAK